MSTNSSIDRSFERWREHADSSALAAVFDACAPGLLRLAIHLVGDPHAAEDLVQQTFVTAIERATTWDGERSIERWMQGILANHARDLRRAARSRDALGDEFARALRREERTPLAESIERELSADVARAVDALPEALRAVVLLRLRHGLAAADIAHVLGTSPGAVRVRLHRARELLRRSLPASVVGSLAFVVEPSRGLAAVRELVLAHAASTVPAAHVLAVPGTLAMKKVSLAVLALAVVAGVAALVDGLARRDRGSGESARSIQAVALGVESPAAHADTRARELDALATSETRSAASPTSGGTRIAGRVVDLAQPGSGAPVEPARGIEVTARIEREGIEAVESRAATDERGEFALDVEIPPSTRASVTILTRGTSERREGRAVRPIDVGVRAVAEVVVERAPVGSLRGTTLDAYGEPLAGVRVAVRTRASKGEAREPVTALSDERGRFELHPASESSMSFEAVLDGFALLETDGPRPLERGGFAEASLVLAPSGTLAVRVVDEHSAPRSGVRVRAQLSTIEPRLLEKSSDVVTTSWSAVTDQHGVAEFGRAWQGKRLEVRVEGALAPFESMREGRLVRALEGGAPIRIGRSGRLVLEHRLAPEIMTRGRVLRADLTPAPGASVEALDADAKGGGARGWTCEARTDAFGRFELRWSTDGPPERIRFVASEQPRKEGGLGASSSRVSSAASVVVARSELVRRADDPARSGASRSRAAVSDGGSAVVDQGRREIDSMVGSTRHAASASRDAHAAGATTPALDLDEALASGAARELEIVLAPLAEISGRVRDEDEKPVRGYVRAVPAGASSRVEVDALARTLRARTDAQGAFAIGSVPSGDYDLYVVREEQHWYTFPQEARRFASVAAGSSGLDLVWKSAGEGVRVRVRAVSTFGEVASTTVLRAARVERTGAPREAAPSSQRASATSGWPEDVPLDFTGVSGGASAEHEDVYGLDGLRGSEHALAPLGEGVYAFGVLARLADGRACYPTSTPFRSFAAGEHEIVFECVPVAELQGRVIGGSAIESLEIALADESGALLLIPRCGGRAERPSRTLALRDDGWFKARRVPQTSLRVRIGTRVELLRGEFRAERRVVVEPGMLPLEIELR